MLSDRFSMQAAGALVRNHCQGPQGPRAPEFELLSAMVAVPGRSWQDGAEVAPFGSVVNGTTPSRFRCCGCTVASPEIQSFQGFWTPTSDVDVCEPWLQFTWIQMLRCAGLPVPNFTSQVRVPGLPLCVFIFFMQNFSKYVESEEPLREMRRYRPDACCGKVMRHGKIWKKTGIFSKIASTRSCARFLRS